MPAGCARTPSLGIEVEEGTASAAPPGDEHRSAAECPIPEVPREAVRTYLGIRKRTGSGARRRLAEGRNVRIVGADGSGKTRLPELLSAGAWRCAAAEGGRGRGGPPRPAGLQTKAVGMARGRIPPEDPPPACTSTSGTQRSQRGWYGRLSIQALPGFSVRCARTVRGVRPARSFRWAKPAGGGSPRSGTGPTRLAAPEMADRPASGTTENVAESTGTFRGPSGARPDGGRLDRTGKASIRNFPVLHRSSTPQQAGSRSESAAT